MGAERQVSPDRPVRVMVSAGLWTAMSTCLGTSNAFPFSMVHPGEDATNFRDDFQPLTLVFGLLENRADGVSI